MQASLCHSLPQLHGHKPGILQRLDGCSHVVIVGTNATQLALSPTLNFFTPSPSSTMMPETSEPGMKGSLGLTWYSPCRRYPRVCVASEVQHGRVGCCPGQRCMLGLQLPTLICR